MMVSIARVVLCNSFTNLKKYIVYDETDAKLMEN